MAPQLTIKGPGQRRRGGHSSSSSSSQANKEARYLMQLQISRSHREQDADSTYRPDIKPIDALFQQFLPEQLVE
ncbi:hypothetical protein S40293_11593 [Stachybotrys chartarum IBT 40293]|nr:hypothetical protein S40293_11593 [Stachybotrys chartarum IBT 40293]